MTVFRSLSQDIGLSIFQLSKASFYRDKTKKEVAALYNLLLFQLAQRNIDRIKYSRRKAGFRGLIES